MSWRRWVGATCVLSVAAVGACGNQAFFGIDGTDAGATDASSSDASGSRDADPTDTGTPSDASAIDATSEVDADAGEDSGLPLGTITLVSGLQNPHELVVRNGHLFWTNFSESAATGSVSMMNTDGTGFVKIADAVHANRIAVDDTQAFWTDFASPNATGSRLNATPFDGGSTVVFSDSIAPMGVAANDDTVFFASFFGFSGSGLVQRFDKSGNLIATMALLNSPLSLAADDAGFAWTQFGTPALDGGAIVTMDLDASPGPAFGGLPLPWGIVLSGSNAYYTVAGSLDASAPGSVGVLDRTGDASPGTIATSNSRPLFITADATRIYWTEEGIGAASGLVRYAAKADKVPHDLAIAQERPHGIAVDASFVYWTSYASGKIFRTPLP